MALGPGSSINEGSTFTRSGSFTGPGSSYTATVDYGDGSGSQVLSLNPGHTFNLSHFYADNGADTIAVRIADWAGDMGVATLLVSVLNVPPTATFSNSGPVAHGNPVTFSFTNQYSPSPTDRAAGFTYSYDFLNDGVFEVAGVTNPSWAWVFNTAGTYTVHGRITDIDGAFTDYWTTVTVN